MQARWVWTDEREKTTAATRGGRCCVCEAGAPASDEEGLAIFGGAAETERTVTVRRDPKGFKRSE